MICFLKPWQTGCPCLDSVHPSPYPHSPWGVTHVSVQRKSVRNWVLQLSFSEFCVLLSLSPLPLLKTVLQFPWRRCLGGVLYETLRSLFHCPHPWGSSGAIAFILHLGNRNLLQCCPFQVWECTIQIFLGRVLSCLSNTARKPVIGGPTASSVLSAFLL